MTSSRGNDAPNQFIIRTKDGTYFQSYNSIIAFIPNDSTQPTLLDENRWNYSNTTSKYRNSFLDEGIAETRRKIKDGTYKLANLNN